MSESVIVIENLSVEFDKRTILDGLSLNVKKGEVFGFLGPNGAGKSTTLKSILGLVFPKKGNILQTFFSGSMAKQLMVKSDIPFLFL